MLHKLTTIWLLLAAFCASAAAAQVCGYNPLKITSPKAGQDLSAAEEVKIAWESTLGGDVDYSIVYSVDGKAFDREIGSKIEACEYAWKPEASAELLGWIKVKAYRQGYLLGESTAAVSFVPSSAIVVSKADQKVLHFSDGKLKGVFTCSTALAKYDLKPGRYRVYSRQKKHWSREWKVWMPHSLFFHEGYALHATSMIRRLGRPASHGCIRLRPKDAAALYEAVSIGTPVIVLPKSQGCSAMVCAFKRDETVAAKPVTAAKN